MWQRRNKRSNDPEDGKGRHEGEKDQNFNFTREITYESVEKLKVVVLTMLFCIGVMVQPALAATMVQDGIEATLTTDKENYQQGEEITVTLTVTNTNRTEATNVSLETFLPDHFVVAENNETAKQVTSLKAGETITLQTVCTVKDSDTKKMIRRMIIQRKTIHPGKIRGTAIRKIKTIFREQAETKISLRTETIPEVR